MATSTSLSSRCRCASDGASRRSTGQKISTLSVMKAQATNDELGIGTAKRLLLIENSDELEGT